MANKNEFSTSALQRIKNLISKQKSEVKLNVTNEFTKNVKIIECPRDAMQGLKVFLPTIKKANYINSLLKVGFDTIDFGSFVSPKAIPSSLSSVLTIASFPARSQEIVLQRRIIYLPFLSLLRKE